MSFIGIDHIMFKLSLFLNVNLTTFSMLVSYHQRALAKYIKKHACSNAKTEDLWAVLEEESHEPVNKLMNSWTKQKGYPVVSARLIDNKLEFEQVPTFPQIFLEFRFEGLCDFFTTYFFTWNASEEG